MIVYFVMNSCIKKNNNNDSFKKINEWTNKTATYRLKKKNSSPFQTKIRIFSPTALSLFYVPSYFYAILHATAISISSLNLISTYAAIRKHVCQRAKRDSVRMFGQNIRTGLTYIPITEVLT